MPDNVNETVAFKNSAMEISLLNEKYGTHIIAKCKDFGGYTMEADIMVSKPEGYETLNVVIHGAKRPFNLPQSRRDFPQAARFALERAGTASELTVPFRASISGAAGNGRII